MKMMMMITPTIDVAFLSRRLFARRPTTRDGQRTPLNAHRGGARRIHDDDDDFASSSCARLLLKSCCCPLLLLLLSSFFWRLLRVILNLLSAKGEKILPFSPSPLVKKEGAHIIRKKKGPRDLLDSFFVVLWSLFFFLCVCGLFLFLSFYRAL